MRWNVKTASETVLITESVSAVSHYCNKLVSPLIKWTDGENDQIMVQQAA